MTIAQLARRAFRTLDRNSPAILTALGVAGVVSTAILASKATLEAQEAIRKYESKENGLWIRSSLKERILLVWPLYVPPVGMATITITAIIGSQSINSRRQAALMSGLALSETALREYQDKTIELEGPKTHQKIQEAIVGDHLDKNPPMGSETVIPTGLVLCYDDYTGRYFHSTMERIRQAANDVNAMMLNGDMYASLNDFYMILGLSPTKVGEEVGWSTENLIDLNFTSKLGGEDGSTPVLAFGFRAKPLLDYYKFR